MDIHIYDGSEALKTSVTHALATLRTVLLPQYTVQTITPHTLVSQPWKSSCALLVVPQCHHTLQTATSTSIKGYVESGGLLLVFGAGAFHSERDQDGAASISKSILFSLSDKNAGKYIHIVHAGEDDSQEASTLQVQNNDTIEGIRSGKPNRFTGFDERNSSVLAKYSKDGESSVAGIALTVGAGKVAIWTPSIEAPLAVDSAPAVSTTSGSKTSLDPEEKQRLDLVRETLISLSLPLPIVDGNPISRPLPQFLTSTPLKTHIVPKILDLIAAPLPGSQLSTFKDENDTFDFHHLSESANLVHDARANAHSTPDKPSHRHIITCPHALPDREQTPLFDLHSYYEALTKAREEQSCTNEPDSWGFGEALLYGEVVTSTQTMLDKNPRLLSRLPPPLVSLASYQLAGRGRGSNVWLSPKGCLQLSILLRTSLSSFPASKLVFVQYLFALAVVEACQSSNVLGKRGKHVRLKWPNDIYALVDGEQKKVGGILVNTNFSGGMVDVVIGCGLNVLNAAPISSLAQLLSPEDRHILTIEHTAANILAKFEKMWGTFIRERGSFEEFMSSYLERWLHSDQLVTVTTVTPHQQVRIAGITSDHGLLRTIPERSGGSSGTQGFIDLQPDGNSFDMMAGLIKSKT